MRSLLSIYNTLFCWMIYLSEYAKIKQCCHIIWFFCQLLERRPLLWHLLWCLFVSNGQLRVWFRYIDSLTYKTGFFLINGYLDTLFVHLQRPGGRVSRKVAGVVTSSSSPSKRSSEKRRSSAVICLVRNFLKFYDDTIFDIVGVPYQWMVMLCCIV
jgi:hypothetical protein